MVTLNKTHKMILVCAADDFRKYRKNAEIEILKKNHKKTVIIKKIRVWCFSSRLDGFVIT